MKYNIVSNEGKYSSVTVFAKGDTHIATPSHPNFLRIIAALEAGASEKDVLALFSAKASIMDRFKAAVTRALPGQRARVEKITKRVVITDSKILLDGEEVDSALADQIIRYHAEGNDDYLPLVLFMEKLYRNPNPHSVDHLFRWMQNKDLIIADDGDFFAYKGILENWDSKTAGTATSNGVLYKGKPIPNKIGNVVEMPRPEVTFDPKVTCSRGLHAGTYSYASGFGPKVVLVKIDPRDVVSVPVDCNGEKLRVCKYKVTAVVGRRLGSARMGRPRAGVVV